jgi:pilus assembly protein TadC
LVLGQSLLLEVEREGLRADGLVSDVVESLQVRVVQRLFNCTAKEISVGTEISQTWTLTESPN